MKFLQSKLLLMAVTLAFALPLGIAGTAAAGELDAPAAQTCEEDGETCAKRKKRRAKKSSTKKRRSSKARRRSTKRKTTAKRGRRTTTRRSSARRSTRRSTTRRTTRRRTTRRRHVTHRRRRTVSHGHHGGHTTVVHHEESAPRTRTRTRRRNENSTYLALGLGVVGIDSPENADTGTGLTLGLGFRQDQLGLELGILAAAQNSDARNEFGEPVQELSLGGGYVDAKLYPFKGGAIEPYVQGGVGFYQVGTENTQDLTPAIDVGAGADLRLGRSVAVGGRYMYHGFWLGDAAQTDAGETDNTWSAMGTVTLYF
jgi:hypothetical protein